MRAGCPRFGSRTLETRAAWEPPGKTGRGNALRAKEEVRRKKEK